MMRMHLNRLRFLAMALGLATSCAAAETIYHAASCAIELDDWALTPITSEAEGGLRVHSFLALNQGTAYGASLQAVWYIKDTENECSWTAKTWEAASPWDAIKTVKAELSIPDADDIHWAVTVGPTPGSEPKPTFDYSKGFVADDGLGRDVNTLPDRDAWVQWLVEIGYKAADVKFEKAVESTDPAYPSTVLSQYASAVEFILTQTTPPPAPPIPGPGAPPTPVVPAPAWPPPAAPSPPPVVPGTLPGGPVPAPVTPPGTYCCTPNTFHLRKSWSGYMARGGWMGPNNCGTSNGQPACCGYTQLICRYRQRWQVDVTCAPPTFTYTLEGIDEECWEHTIQCEAVTQPNGTRACVAAPNGAPGCNGSLTPPIGPPPPNQPIITHPY